MIVFDLKCDQGHKFESWFQNSAAFESQRDAGLVSCPMCQSTHVSKALMAPAVSRKSNQAVVTDDPHLQPTDAERAAVETTTVPRADALSATDAARAVATEKAVDVFRDIVEEMRREVEKSGENVGKRFPEEARKMHYGEAAQRAIYGEASLEDAQELVEEGIEIIPLPGRRQLDS
ncbi:MAG: hypothetical protein CMF31_06855 [Kordiimonas sp.]|nr:hypothetical protein [Kordiimonas sp.]|tara:strand:+ start:5533 stop:6060 length:528 start_codon:yes stop_codon:yes gene_type:complete